MITIDNIIKEVSEKTQIDKDIVEIICKHPFLFTVDVMKDEKDTHDILFAKLFKFKLKNRFKKNKNKPNSPNYEDQYCKEH